MSSKRVRPLNGGFERIQDNVALPEDVPFRPDPFRGAFDPVQMAVRAASYAAAADPRNVLPVRVLSLGRGSYLFERGEQAIVLGPAVGQRRRSIVWTARPVLLATVTMRDGEPVVRHASERKRVTRRPRRQRRTKRS